MLAPLPDAADPAAAVITTPSLLSVSSLRRSFGDTCALNGLNLEVSAGELFGVLGATGAGKTTLFQVLAGHLRPDEGTVTFEGQPVRVEDPTLASRIGLVFQHGNLDESLSARENLIAGARMLAMPKPDTLRRMDELLELFALGDRRHERVSEWSRGMRRRLEIARALIHRPKLLLLDEPTQGIDDASFRRIWTHLRELRLREGLTVIATTQRAEEAEQCDRVAILEQGQMLTCDAPRVLVSRLEGDLLTLEADRPEEIAWILRHRFQLEPLVGKERVTVVRRDGHALIADFVAAFPPGRLQSVSLRRPALVDVYERLRE